MAGIALDLDRGRNEAEGAATGGGVSVAPATAPHRFEVVGPGRVQMVDVHASPTFVTEWLA